MRVALAARALVTFVLCAAVIERAAAQIPLRDAVRSPGAGTAVIAGTVVTDDQDQRPLRRARVLLTTAEHENGRMVITDDAGQFTFTGLPASRYLLSARKGGYVTSEYGAKRSMRSGVAIVLEDGQRLTNAVVRLPRGGVIAGTIVDQRGQAMSSVIVRPLRYQFAEHGRRTLAPIETAGYIDDLGQYRIWGLDAGEYVVAASIEESEPPGPDDLVRLTDADIKQAEADASGLATRATLSPSRRGAYAPVYYPGTFALSEARSIRLRAGEERADVDFQLSLTSTAKVEGSVVIPDGVDRQDLSVQMTNSGTDDVAVERSSKSARVDDHSHFVFTGVPPGQYTLTARAQRMPKGFGAGAGFSFSDLAIAQWAQTDVTVSGDDISGISLVLQPAFSVSGKIQVEPSGSPPDLSRLIVVLTPGHSNINDHFGAAPALVDANGMFTIAGVTPGRYQVHAGIMAFGSAGDIWQVKSAIVNGRETVDQPIELRTSVDGVVVTLTDRMPSLSGVVRNASGQAAPDCHVVVFAKDRKFWMPDSRRLTSVRPGSDGTYVIRAVPAGEYFVTAVNDLENGEWFDPSVLEQLSTSALTITLADGEKKTQDLRVVARR